MNSDGRSQAEFEGGNLKMIDQYIHEGKSKCQNESKYIDGIVRDCSISSALAMDILQSCTKPSIYADGFMRYFITVLLSVLCKLGRFFVRFVTLELLSSYAHTRAKKLHMDGTRHNLNTKSLLDLKITKCQHDRGNGLLLSRNKALLQPTLTQIFVASSCY